MEIIVFWQWHSCVALMRFCDREETHFKKKIVTSSFVEGTWHLLCSLKTNLPSLVGFSYTLKNLSQTNIVGYAELIDKSKQLHIAPYSPISLSCSFDKCKFMDTSAYLGEQLYCTELAVVTTCTMIKLLSYYM